MKSAVALRHVAFEDLGTWETVLRGRGYQVHYVDVPDVSDLASSVAATADLLVVLGGPIGVDQEEEYPFLIPERRFVRRRLESGAPTLGVCLGAQLVAAALGAGVAAGAAVEIGFAPIEVGPGENVLAALRDVPVFHWHADQFALPAGATSLARTEVCPQQAFAIGSSVLAVQFHPELDADRIERWLVGHAHELAARGIDPNELRFEAARLGERLRLASAAVLNTWLDGLGSAGR